MGFSIGEKVVLYPGFSVHTVTGYRGDSETLEEFLQLDDNGWHSTKNIERIGDTLRSLKERVTVLEEHITPPDPLSYAKITLTVELHRLEDKIEYEKVKPVGGDNLIGFLDKRIKSLKLALEKLNEPEIQTRR